MVMKPLDQKSYTEQAMSNGKGITWLDNCRIPYGDEMPVVGNRHHHDRGNGYGLKAQWSNKGDINCKQEKQWKQDVERRAYEKGRFPANLVVSDGVLAKRQPEQYPRLFPLFFTGCLGRISPWRGCRKGS